MRGGFRRIHKAQRAFSIQSQLIAFALALVLPMLGFAGFLLWRFALSEQARVVESARQTAEQSAFAVDRELTGMVATLQALATSPALQSGAFAPFQRQATAAVRVPGARITLRDPSGQLRLDTRAASRPPSLTTQAPSPDGIVNPTMVATKSPSVSDLVVGPGGQEPIVLVQVPVLRGEEVAYVLSMSVPPEHWRAVLQQTVLTPEWSAGLVDRKGAFIARLRNHDQFVGKMAPGGIGDLKGLAGTVTRTDAEGRSVLFSYRRPALAGWTVGIVIPTSVVHAPLRRSVALLAGAGLSLLGLSLVLATLFGRRIAKPMQALSASAARFGRGEPVEPLTTGLQEVNAVGRSLAAAAIGLRERAAALRLSEERYRLATESFQGGVFDYDVATDRMERTPRYDEILGDTPGGSAFSTKSGWHERIHPDDRPAFEAARRSMYEAGRPQYEAEYRVRHANGTWVWIWHRALAVRNNRGAMRRVVGAILDITERKRAEEHLKLLVHELNHRVKNTLTTVQSIAAHTLRATVAPAEAREAFEARLLALSRVHNSLTSQNWEGVTLRSIAADTLEPYRVTQGDRFHVDGPDVWVAPETAVALAMALNELATNAAKYGALTSPQGTVTVSWRVDLAAEPPRVELRWAEAGGPPVTKPSRKGFGSRLIERSLGGDPGSVRLDYDPDGVTCTFSWNAPVTGEAATAGPDQPAPLPAVKA